MAFIHTYDDDDIIAGQGTLGLEIIEQCPGVDTIIVPVGGGGLIAGISCPSCKGGERRKSCLGPVSSRRS